ncbi:hypothetical protein M758_11G066300 [Ceratodon purpureus]|nr:hypothetical protein M758_11G066300 [Ceratodon purpureus]
MMSSTRNYGGAGRAGGLQVDSVGRISRYRRLIALLLVMSMFASCVQARASTARALAQLVDPAPPPQQFNPSDLPNIPVFRQYEADALNAVYNKWIELNPQLSSLLNWSPDVHPCNTTKLDYNEYYQVGGAWRGVECSVIPVPLLQNATGNYFDVLVTTVRLYGSNSACTNPSLYPEEANFPTTPFPELCRFDGITGELPPEFGKLEGIIYLRLINNSLSGPVFSNALNASSKLRSINLRHNKFNGSLLVSPDGTLFSSTLNTLDLSFNQLSGLLDFRGLSANRALWELQLMNNSFSGTFFTGPYFDPAYLYLANNDFTSVEFAVYTGFAQTGGSTVYMPSLGELRISNNKLRGPFPAAILNMPSLTYLDLIGNNFSGTVDFSSFTGITQLYLRGNSFSGPVDFRSTDSISSLSKLDISNNNFDETFFSGPYLNPTYMNLSNNYFKNIVFDTYNGTAGHIDNDTMPSLQILDIHNNNLSGEFPSQILRCSGLKTLVGGQNRFKTLRLPDISFENSSFSGIFLTNNSIDAVQYPKNLGPFSPVYLQISNFLFLGGNPICNKIENALLSIICRQNKASPPLTVVQPKSDRTWKVIISSTLGGSLFMVLVGIFTLKYIRKLAGRVKSLNSILEELAKKDVKPKIFTYREIRLATRNFDQNYKLGQGGFGVVYKGELSDGTPVAVKKLTKVSSQMLSEFLNEVVVISGLRHRNLVKLKGCCLGNGEERMLVFEYVGNGNLAEALWKRDGLNDNLEFPCLNWPTRYNIIVRIARGLAYLHQDLDPPVIHRDIKAANILLDMENNPKIADFGAALLFPTLDNKDTHMTSTIAGTQGYMPPEYANYGHVSTALDVYSFGVLVLEIMCGKRCLDYQRSSEEIYLPDWARRQYRERALLTIIDSQMIYSSSESEEMIRVVRVALACLQFQATWRPNMNDVVSMLVGDKPTVEIFRNFDYEDGRRPGTSNCTSTSETSSSTWQKQKIEVDTLSLFTQTTSDMKRI